MLHRRRSPAFRAPAIVLLAVLLLPGCRTWRPPSAPLEPLLTGPDPPRELLVKLHDGTKLYLKSPHVEGDSLRGRWSSHNRTQRKEDPKPGTPTSVALADIQAVEVSKVNAAETILLVAVIGGIAAIFIAAASMDPIIGYTP